jgi:hypothetical protein
MMKKSVSKLLTSGLFALASTLLAIPAAEAGDCCEYTVEGCGNEVKVCIPEKCGSAAADKAKKAFEGAYKCKSVKIPSHIGTCSNSKCEIDFR